MNERSKVEIAAWKSMILYRMRGTNWRRYLAIRGWVRNETTNKWSHPSKPGHSVGWGQMLHYEREWARNKLMSALNEAGLPVPDVKYRAITNAELVAISGEERKAIMVRNFYYNQKHSEFVESEGTGEYDTGNSVSVTEVQDRPLGEIGSPSLRFKIEIVDFGDVVGALDRLMQRLIPTFVFPETRKP